LIFRETDLPGCLVVEPERVVDDRGFFARTFSADEFVRRGLDPSVSQVSVSHNAKVGTLRGLHYQLPPYGETKLVRCTNGRVFDVAVDVARRRWTAVELSRENGLGFYIPEGFAHGFLTLEPESEVLYQISTPYIPDASAGIRWDDPSLAIDWPSMSEMTISERDRRLPLLR
jgi:dTDP-4-dehydrorhamnose 3,5-epimerase